MIQKYEVSGWNEWDGASLKPATDGNLVLYADAEKEIAALTAENKRQADHIAALERELDRARTRPEGGRG